MCTAAVATLSINVRVKKRLQNVHYIACELEQECLLCDFLRGVGATQAARAAPAKVVPMREGFMVTNPDGCVTSSLLTIFCCFVIYTYC